MNKLNHKGMLALLSPLVWAFSFGLSTMLISHHYFQYSLWIYIFTYSFIGVMGNVLVASKNPNLMNRRGVIYSNAQKDDKIIMFIYVFLYCFVLPMVAGLDSLNQHLIPIESFYIALFIFVLGSLLALSAILNNPYFESLNRLQENHQVIDKGLYKIIRHPGYTGMFLSSLVHPILLRSRLSFLIAILLIILVIIRTAKEDKFLRENLEGYQAYCDRVKDRLIPYIW